MKIGIIGAENSHAVNIAKTINIEKKLKGFSVDYIWGETPAFAKKAAKDGRIPTIVAKQRDMLGKIDALVVDHRHARYHVAAALPFVEAGIPTFVDKPFCYRAAEGKKLLRAARKHGTPISSFSAVPNQESVDRFIKKVQALSRVEGGATYGPASLKNAYGGIFFYGIHQVELLLKIFGGDVKSVTVTRKGENAAAHLAYGSGMIVTANFIKEGCPGFHATAVGDGNVVHQALPSKGHLRNMKLFTRMFRTGEEPKSHEDILRPIQVLEAIKASLRSGRKERVAR